MSNIPRPFSQELSHFSKGKGAILYSNSFIKNLSKVAFEQSERVEELDHGG